MDSLIERAAPAMQIVAVAISYLMDLFKRIGDIFSFATGITSVD